MAWRDVIWAMLLVLGSGEAAAIDRVVLEIGEISMPGVTVSGAAGVLDLSTETPRATLHGDRVQLGQSLATFNKLSVACTQVVVKEPDFGCRRGRMTGLGVDIDVAAMFGSSGWSVRGHAASLPASRLRRIAAPWFSLPESYSVNGKVQADIEGSRRSGELRVKLDVRLFDLDLANEASTIVAEKVAARVQLNARQTGRGFAIKANVDSSAGQALAGPVLLDFGANPLQLSARGNLRDGILGLQDIAYVQKNLLAANSQARVRLGTKPTIERARINFIDVRFPAAYTSFLQIALAATDFGTLEASGKASGGMEIESDAPARIDLQIDDVDLKDDKTQFMMSDLHGILHWVRGADTPVEASRLAWSKARAYGLSGGTAELDLRARGSGFELLREARVPIFDGAVVVHSLAARNLARGEAEVEFDAHVEPISMPLLSKAFGWPELSGQLAARIPGLTYRNHLLTLNGAVTANVFDGTVTGSNFRLRDPLGPWPRLFADVTARRLDLELVTSTFSIGSITGRLDADLKGMELFNWSPVAFDARLYSTPDDRSPRLISQKAVTSISSIGGGGSGVTRALQSGVLRFFDRFRYDRIGINCRLRNEVCLMTGIEPHGDGYYIVKGSGIPRIDIIGNAGRVDWPQLVTQIVQGMRSENVIVR